MRRRAIIVDDFYQDPDLVRAVALRSEYDLPLDQNGWRSVSHILPGTKQRIGSALGTKLCVWTTEGMYEDVNGVFYLALSRGKRAERVQIHSDWSPPNSLTGLVYLTPEPPLDSGTSFWRHRATGLRSEPTAAESRALRTQRVKLSEKLAWEGYSRGLWEEEDRVANVYNRALFFNPRDFHSATRHFGSTVTNGRIYHSFHFVVAPLDSPRPRYPRRAARRGNRTGALAERPNGFSK